MVQPRVVLVLRILLPCRRLKASLRRCTRPGKEDTTSLTEVCILQYTSPSLYLVSHAQGRTAVVIFAETDFGGK